jgi:hypothetical protein
MQHPAGQKQKNFNASNQSRPKTCGYVLFVELLFGHGTSENILLAVAKHCTLPLATVALTRPEHLIKEFIIFPLSC